MNAEEGQATKNDKLRLERSADDVWMSADLFHKTFATLTAGQKTRQDMKFIR